MSRRPTLQVESLEDRSLPTALGSPWPSPDTLTLSFAPDGTRVGNATSSLFDTLASAGTDAAWQREILRAFQTWAVQTNANIALVTDGGAAFGTSGEIEGDFRFGDIRIGAIPLSNDSLANASPFDWRIGTWSGDVVFNSRSPLAINPSSPTTAADLFTAALHEAGHVFGMEHSDDPQSAMSETYTGRKTGLTSADIAAVQSYYGARSKDQYEGQWGNNSFSTATPVDTLVGSGRLTADIQNINDVDTYSLLNTSLLGSLAVRVKTSGISLLQAKVSVYDSWGRLLASKTASGPGQDVEVGIPKTLLNLGYRIRVTGANDDVFGVGSYDMEIVRSGLLTAVPFLVETLSSSSLLGALPLVNLDSGEANHESFGAEADLDSTSDVDYFSVAVPQTTDANDRAMVVTVYNESGKAHPDLAVFDSLGRPVDAYVLNNDGSTLSIQVLGISRGETFYVRVSNPAGADATGRYQLTADFQPPAENNLKLLDAGRLDDSRTVSGGTLKVNVARLYQFSLSSQTDSTAAATLTLTVRDARGTVLLRMSKGAGDPAVNQALYLDAGTYTVEIALSVPAGQAIPAVNYWLYLGVDSDPVGPYAPDSTDTSTEDTSMSSSGSDGTEYQSADTYDSPDGYWYSF